ncbi:extracellular solute-binding protein [Cytobacillus firmus]|uniref:extracellular solute-binding protein n=1 Tax=Cytobacillus firmus TaxID=1399 RepID=UPI0018CF2DBE|nr:extracellular solute-binding protein [Cytobacillus firmus]MBG9444195.1 ABC transporter substrate-binding protein [Cytobacillus firmus]WHY33946.1 extracellular solute-binding protein [Cytobacillus firmus]
MRKSFIAILSLILVLGLLAACTNKEEAGQGDNKDKGGATTIRIVMKDDNSSNPVSEKYYDAIEKGLLEDENIKVNFELVDLPQGNYAEKLNLLLNSGEIPDMIYFQGGDQAIADQGLLEDLRPYIKDSKYLKDIIQPFNEKRLANYPYLLWIKPLAPKVPVIRGDWFNQMETSKALMENPTVDTYYSFFKELVEKQPGGDKPKYAITVAGDIAEIDYMFDMAFGINKTWLQKEDGSYEYSRVSKQQKEKLEFYNKLYKEGLLDPQYLTKQWDTKEKAFFDGEAAIIPGTAGKVIDIYEGKMVQVSGEEASLVMLPPAKGEYQGFGATDVTKESRGIAISANSENKDLVFKILDYMASPEGQMIDRFGFEGEHYNEVDGKLQLTDKYYSEWFARFWEPADYTPATPVDDSTPLLSESAEKSLQSAEEFYEEDNSFIIPEEYVANWDAMQNLYMEFTTDIITGKRPISDFEKFVKEWNEAGGEQITELANENLK